MYRDVGTNIDATVRRVDEGTFDVQVTIEQSSVLDDEQPKAQPLRVVANVPVFRSFRFTNSAVLKDGQTSQFTTAGDTATGEVVRVDVTLNIVR